MLLKLTTHLNRNQIEPLIISLTDIGLVGDLMVKSGMRVINLGIPAGTISFRGLWALRRILLAEKPDLIQGWMYHGNLAVRLVSYLLPNKVPVLWSIRGTHTDLSAEKPISAATIWFGAQLSKQAVTVINNSRVSARQHERELGYSMANVVVIPNGFETDVFRPDSEARKMFRLSIGVGDDALLVGLVGRFHPVKDHATFFQGASVVKAQIPNARFVLVGHGIDQSNAELISLVRQAGVRDVTYLMGVRDDLPRVNAALDIACLSSVSEGFPNVLGEAMSCAIPCVSTDVGDSAWIIGNTGLVVPPRHPALLANAMCKLLSMEPEHRQNLGKLARCRINEKFSLEVVVTQYQAIYQETLMCLDRRE